MEVLRSLKSRLWAPSPPPVYQPQDIPGLTRFPVKCHPQADRVCKELDDLFVGHFPFRTERERKKYIKAEHNKWACMALPLVRDDRILDAVKANTLLFLLDDLAEDMSVEEGKAFYAKLIPLAKGAKLPDRNDALEWITYDTFASMRECDAGLTDEVIDGAIVCLNAQVDPARLKCEDMGSLLRQRVKEGGCAFEAALIRFGMDFHIPSDVQNSLQVIHDSYSKLGIIVNDIESFDKERNAWETHGKEGAHMLNMVKMMAKDGAVSYEAAKRICYILVRESELEHERLVAGFLTNSDWDRESLAQYVYALGCCLGGNEVWSQTTARYHDIG